jgi:hypothetical protein
MDSFVKVLERYSSVGNAGGTDKITVHSYGNVYNSIFHGLKNSGIHQPTVLENGIYSGAFLQAVADYLPYAMVYGVDITLKKIRYGWDHPRIRMYQMDGTKRETAEAIGVYYNIIIEDGSHLPAHQIASLDAFAPYLKKGGVYVIEDIDGQYEAYLREELYKVAVKHQLVMVWEDLRWVKNRFDDILAIFIRD